MITIIKIYFILISLDLLNLIIHLKARNRTLDDFIFKRVTINKLITYLLFLCFLATTPLVILSEVINNIKFAIKTIPKNKNFIIKIEYFILGILIAIFAKIINIIKCIKIIFKGGIKNGKTK